MLVGSVDSLPSSPAASEGVAAQVTAAHAPSHATAADAATTVQASASAVREAVSQANDALRSLSQAVEFQYDSDARTMVIRLVDTQDRTVLRQIPSPEMIEIARALDRMQTMLLRDKA